MIGILSGMGPKSTRPFVDKVVDQCQKIYGDQRLSGRPQEALFLDESKASATKRPAGTEINP